MDMTPVLNSSDYSLQSRLLIAFSVLLFIFLGFTGVVLDRAFRNSVEAGAADRLQLQIYVLLGAVEEEHGEFYFLEDLLEDRFGQLNSGLYGFISQSSVGELWRSDSALAFTLPDPQVLRERIGVGASRFRRMTGEQGEDFFLLSYGILWEDGISEFSFSVVENAAPYFSEISNFRTSLWSWLGGVAILLLLIQFFLMRWGLSPLSRMANDLKKIETGDKDKLEGSYPRELRGVTENLNLLIETERKQQTRYRTTLGDLVHSLKTPLAVIAGILPKLNSNSSEELEQQLGSVNDQLERMNQIVTYQLQRAVQSNNSSSLAKQVRVAAAVEKVLDALQKVYADKSIQLQCELDDGAIFHGDERDLVEVLGNVLDNAFKYGNKRVCVSVKTLTDRVRGVELIVEDDGPGIPEEQQEFVLQRGARADTLVQGQGIGLAVVTDIISSYGGEITVGSSELGGTRIRIIFAPH
jgi:two-component system sensor histidine kinase PhoQ